ncbi:ubiquinol oxidase subunit II [uncultured Sphingomonas sp.]|uniref:ubiquinol oxidase subunit II n=1 Tax=uncultured Sphingomonas sp. TaxID=158754 RepID=UPI0037495992
MSDSSFSAMRRRLKAAVVLPALAVLAACNTQVLDPAGDIALQQRDIIYISTALMLVIIVPVMALICVFAWRYRKGNKDATYDPDFHHSTSLELVIWSAPLLIIICLGALTWWSTHLLDPFRPVNRISATKAVDPKVKPLDVQVVSLDWKWLLIYPEQGIATVNELALPVDRPVRFHLTSSNMMNTFYAPTLAGMIYTMPGMRSTLHAVLNKPGKFDGMSANYSGSGFSNMRFTLYGVKPRDFDAWVNRVKAAPLALDTPTYLEIEKPTDKVPPMYFARIQPGLFDRVYQRCVRPGTPCMRDMMRHDQDGGAMPSMHGSQPPAGQKPEGAIFQGGNEMDVSPNRGKEPAKPSGNANPNDPNNRDMSRLDLPALRGAPRAAAV